MNAQQIASRIGVLENEKGNLNSAHDYYRSIGDDMRCDQIAEALSDVTQELHELRLSQSEA